MGMIVVKDGPAQGKIFNYFGNPKVIVIAERRNGKTIRYHDYGRKANGRYYHSLWCPCRSGSSMDKDV